MHPVCILRLRRDGVKLILCKCVCMCVCVCVCIAMPRCAQTDVLCFVEGVQVLQRRVEQRCWRVSVDHRQALPRLQVSARGLWLSPPAALYCCLLAFRLEPLDLRQRFLGEAAERRGASGREQGRHLRIAKGYRRTGVSLGGAEGGRGANGENT